MKNNKLENSKESGSKCKRGFDDYANITLNVALCFVVISVFCFIFGYSRLGFVLLGICGIIFLLILGFFVFGTFVASKLLKHIPHR